MLGPSNAQEEKHPYYQKAQNKTLDRADLVQNLHNRDAFLQRMEIFLTPQTATTRQRRCQIREMPPVGLHEALERFGSGRPWGDPIRPRKALRRTSGVLDWSRWWPGRPPRKYVFFFHHFHINGSRVGLIWGGGPDGAPKVREHKPYLTRL